MIVIGGQSVRNDALNMKTSNLPGDVRGFRASTTGKAAVGLSIPFRVKASLKRRNAWPERVVEDEWKIEEIWSLLESAG